MAWNECQSDQSPQMYCLFKREDLLLGVFLRTTLVLSNNLTSSYLNFLANCRNFINISVFLWNHFEGIWQTQRRKHLPVFVIIFVSFPGIRRTNWIIRLYPIDEFSSNVPNTQFKHLISPLFIMCFFLQWFGIFCCYFARFFLNQLQWKTKFCAMGYGIEKTDIIVEVLQWLSTLSHTKGIPPLWRLLQNRWNGFRKDNWRVR